jgi:hypothetical protein
MRSLTGPTLNKRLGDFVAVNGPQLAKNIRVNPFVRKKRRTVVLELLFRFMRQR